MPTSKNSESKNQVHGLKAVEATVREAASIMHYGGGRPVTALDGADIERAYVLLRTAQAETKKAMREQRQLVTAAKKVLANWSRGDLAAAVRGLDAVLLERAP